MNGGWITLNKAGVDVDEARIKDAKEDLDTLLVFVSA